MNDKTLSWNNRNKPKGHSKLTKYQDDILYLRRVGHTYKGIKKCLLEEYKLSVSEVMIWYFYNKHLKDKDAPELANVSSEEKQTLEPKEKIPKKEDTETKTREKKVDSDGGSSSKYKEKKDFGIGEFFRTDPMFKKVFTKNEKGDGN